MKIIKIIISTLLFIGAGIIGYFIGDFISTFSILPSTIDRESIKYCASILLANVGGFYLFESNNKLGSIINILLNVILAFIMTIKFGFNALFSISLILLALIGFQLYELIAKKEI